MQEKPNKHFCIPSLLTLSWLWPQIEMKYYHVCLQCNCLPASHWFSLLHVQLLVQKKKRAEENYSDIAALYSCTSIAIRTKWEFISTKYFSEKITAFVTVIFAYLASPVIMVSVNSPRLLCMGKLSMREFLPYCLFWAPLPRDPGKQQVICFLPPMV